MVHSSHIVLITTAENGSRLDKALTALLPALSRSRLQALIETGCVTRQSAKGTDICKDGAEKVRSGQMYTVTVPEIAPSVIRAQEIPLNIIFEDAHLLIINKAPGMTVHPAPGSPDKTLVNALLAHCGESLSGIGGVARPGIVHRIDKDTSGLLVVAKHDKAHHHLSEQLLTRKLKREYIAVVHGVPKKKSGDVEGNIGRHPKDRQRMTVLKEGGKTARTHYKVAETFGDKYALLELQLDTGRTHQIRVHMAHLGHPLVGDQTYGKRGTQQLFPRQALHAAKLKLIHPDTGKEMQFEAPLPGDMEKLIQGLKSS